MNSSQREELRGGFARTTGPEMEFRSLPHFALNGRAAWLWDFPEFRCHSRCQPMDCARYLKLRENRVENER